MNLDDFFDNTFFLHANEFTYAYGLFCTLFKTIIYECMKKRAFHLFPVHFVRLVLIVVSELQYIDQNVINETLYEYKSYWHKTYFS